MLTTIGIRAEDKDRSEKRAPLTPAHVAALVDQGVRVLLEPSSTRIFSDQAYSLAGAEIDPSLTAANIIFGVKEVPENRVLDQTAYCFFSHTIKGQDYNMPLLKQFLDQRATLMDYEPVVDENGRRLIFFGKFAGYAGMIDALWVFGRRLESEGIASPFAAIRQTRDYHGLEDAREALRDLAAKIKSDGLPPELPPIIVGFTGRGNVAVGAQELFDLLPAKTLTPAELLQLPMAAGECRHHIYKVVFPKREWLHHIDAGTAFDNAAFYQDPSLYTSSFSRFAHHLSILVNGIFWAPGSPRLLTRQHMQDKYRNGKSHLRVVADITCDIEGSIEFTLKSTSVEAPVFVYEPEADAIRDGWEGDGPVVLAVDKLPSELPREASAAFGDSLLPFVPLLSKTDFSAASADLKLPQPFTNAVIAHRGKLTQAFAYLSESLQAAGIG